MGKSETRATDDGSKKLLKLTELMSNYISLLSPPKKQQAELQKFFTERAKYDEQITKHTLTIQDLQNKTQNIPKLEQTIQQLKTQIIELQNKTKGLEDSLDSVSESQSVKDLNVRLQTDLKAKDQQTNELTNELKALKSAFDALAQKNEAFSKADKEMGQLRNKLAGEWNKNQGLRQTLLKERESIQTLLQEKEGLEYALRRLERRLLKKGTLRGLSIPVHHLEISEDITGKADAEIQETIQTMNLELQKRLDRIKELEIRNNNLKQQLAQSSTRDLQLQVEQLRSDLEGRKGAVMGLESTRKKLMEQIEALQQRLGDLQNKVMVQGKEIDEKTKTIQSLETAVSSGVHDQHAREVIENLQQQNREFRNQVREGEKIIRSLEKNTKYIQTQLKQQKEQSYKLYTQTRDQVVLIQKLKTAVQQGGGPIDLDIRAIDSVKHISSIIGEEGPSLDGEIKERDRKINRLESYVESLKQEVEDLHFNMTSRDVKIDELSTILKELKDNIATSKAKIVLRPPSADEYRKKKVKL